MRVTQADIARVAKVSQATVSRVLAGDDRVDDSSKSRILRAVNKLNYQPDFRARSLRTQRTGLVGLVIKRPIGGLMDDPFFAALTAGIMDFLVGKPYHLCVEVATDELVQANVYDEMLRTRRVDGLILVEPEADDERILRLQQDRFPFVLIGNPNSLAFSSVDNDNVLAGLDAAQHLVSMGYQKVGFVGAARGVMVSDDRAAGYIEVMNRTGLAPQIWHTDFGYASAYQTAIAILTQRDRPDAIVALDDFMAFGIITAARQLGLRIPEDLGIVSFNDSSLCELLDGGLSSVSLNMNELVSSSMDQLLRVIEAEGDIAPSRHIVPCELKVRGSSLRNTPVGRTH